LPRQPPEGKKALNPNPRKASSPRILVIRRRYLGDVTVLGPMFRNLRHHWPEARISCVVDAPFIDVLTLNPDVDNAWILPAHVTNPTQALSWAWFLSKIRLARFTHVFDLDNRGDTALVAGATGAPFRMVLHHSEQPVLRPKVFNHFVHVSREQWEGRLMSDHYLQTLIAAGVPTTSREVRLVPREEDVATARAQLGPGRILLVHPGSRRRERIWPMKRFAEVCDLAREQLGVRVVLAGGSHEQSFLAEIRRHMRHRTTPFNSSPSVAQFAALAHCSSLLLCHDSGPMHVAAAVGTRVVALHGSQDIRQFSPAGEGHILLQPRLPCDNACVAPKDCVPGNSYHSFCVRRIGVEEVFAALSAQFRAKGVSTRGTAFAF
jgi:ADP-heptose:LPS heptosyltransferase